MQGEILNDKTNEVEVIENELKSFNKKLKYVYGLTIFETAATALVSFVLVNDITNIFGNLSTILVPGSIGIVMHHGINRINNTTDEIDKKIMELGSISMKEEAKVKVLKYK